MRRVQSNQCNMKLSSFNDITKLESINWNKTWSIIVANGVLGFWGFGAWNLELGAWSLELGTWSLELGAGRQLNRDNFWLVRSFDNSRQEKVKNWKR